MTMSFPRPTIDLRLGRTGSVLELAWAPRTATFGASNIEDAIHDAVRAAVDLIDGRSSTGFLWRAEQNGVFVDIHLHPHRASLIVHEMPDPEWSMAKWFPVRGQVLFKLSAAPRRFMMDFTNAVLSLPEKAAVGAGGGHPLWGHPLPSDLIAETSRRVEAGYLSSLNDKEASW